jgi:hypothetical protein
MNTTHWHKLTIGDVATELVARGIPRNDGDWTPGNTQWWVWNNPAPSPQEPLCNLVLMGGTAECYWQLGVASDPRCDDVQEVRFIGETPGLDPIGTLSFWPGLDQAIAMCQAVTAAYHASLDRGHL